MEVSQYIAELNRRIKSGNDEDALEVGNLLRNTDLLREYLKSMGVSSAILERYSCFEKIRGEMFNFAMKPDVEFGEKNVYADNGHSFIQPSFITGSVYSSDSNFLVRKGSRKTLNIGNPNKEGNIVSKETVSGEKEEEQIIDTINKHGVVEKREIRTPGTVNEITRGEDENGFPILIRKSITAGTEKTIVQPDYGYRNLTGIGFDNFGAKIIQDDKDFPGLLEWYETRFPGCTTEPERVVGEIKERTVSMLEAELAKLLQAQAKYAKKNGNLRRCINSMMEYLDDFAAKYERAAAVAKKQEEDLKQSGTSLYRTAEESKSFVRQENTRIGETLRQVTLELRDKINEMDPTILNSSEETGDKQQGRVEDTSQGTGKKQLRSDEAVEKESDEAQTVDQRIEKLSKKIRDAQPKTALLSSENAMLKNAMGTIRGNIAKLPSLGIADRSIVMTAFDNMMDDDRDL